MLLGAERAETALAGKSKPDGDRKRCEAAAAALIISGFVAALPQRSVFVPPVLRDVIQWSFPALGNRGKKPRTPAQPELMSSLWK